MLNYSGHGTCTTSTLSCVCSDGWTGGNCAIRECQKGLSWFAYPSGDNAAHDNWSECSDQGICDRSTGACSCTPGFYGNACQYMVCGGGTAVPCSGHGRCLSMRHLSFESNLNGDATDYIYGTDPNEPTTWDADRIMGCSCDDGYTGYDCSERTCILGNDPGTYNDVKEKQLIRCRATDGTFKLQFRQKATPALFYNITAPELTAALESLDSIYSVKVNFGFENSFCTNSSNINVNEIEFVSPHGDLPPIKFFANNLVLTDTAFTGATGILSIATDGSTMTEKGGNVVASVMGTTESEYCSNRGTCDALTGDCACYGQWRSSDGEGNSGNINDCGYRIPSFSENAVPGGALV